MNRRTVLRQAGSSAGVLVALGLAGCSGDGSETGNTPLPDLQISGSDLESSVDGLTITGQRHELVRGQQHDDVHFAVTVTVRNAGQQEVNLENYEYDLTLYSPDGIDITPGQTWKANPDTVPPGETGTVLVQVSFISAEGVSPEDVDRYEATLSCGTGSSGSYC
ncbi:MAG: hypothetical protein V5A13_05240 [Haloarculaceae archaeon]